MLWRRSLLGRGRRLGGNRGGGGGVVRYEESERMAFGGVLWVGWYVKAAWDCQGVWNRM